jgi:hypothetical protein
MACLLFLAYAVRENHSALYIVLTLEASFSFLVFSPPRIISYAGASTLVRRVLSRVVPTLVAARLAASAQARKASKITRLLKYLDAQRNQIDELTGSHKIISQMSLGTTVLIIEDEDNPLATELFAYALKQLGLQVETFETMKDAYYGTRNIATDAGVDRVVVIAGGNLAHADTSRVEADFGSELFEKLQSVMTLWMVREGRISSLMESIDRHHLLGGFFLRNYLQVAASLASRPLDEQMQSDENKLEPWYRT